MSLERSSPQPNAAKLSTPNTSIDTMIALARLILNTQTRGSTLCPVKKYNRNVKSEQI